MSNKIPQVQDPAENAKEKDLGDFKYQGLVKLDMLALEN